LNFDINSGYKILLLWFFLGLSLFCLLYNRNNHSFLNWFISTFLAIIICISFYFFYINESVILLTLYMILIIWLNKLPNDHIIHTESILCHQFHLHPLDQTPKLKNTVPENNIRKNNCLYNSDNTINKMCGNLHLFLFKYISQWFYRRIYSHIEFS